MKAHRSIIHYGPTLEKSFENEITINDSNKFSYVMGTINLSEMLDETIQLACQNFENLCPQSFQLELCSSSICKHIFTDGTWFQENLLCILEQWQGLSQSPMKKLCQLRVSLETDLSQGDGGPKLQDTRNPTTPTADDSESSSTRHQSLIIPQRPFALNYSSRSHASPSPRCMRATIAFSPKYCPRLSTPKEASFTECSNISSTHSKSPISQSFQPLFLRVEVSSPCQEASVTVPKRYWDNFGQVSKFPVHVMERRIQILGGTYGKSKPSTSELPSIMSSSLNTWHFTIPYNPVSSPECASPQRAVAMKSLTPYALDRMEHPIFTPSHEIPVSQQQKSGQPSSPHTSLPQTPTISHKTVNSTTELSPIQSCDPTSNSIIPSLSNEGIRLESTDDASIQAKDTSPSLLQPSTISADGSIQNKNMQVLLVDDSTLVLKLTRSVLERSGYAVQVAHNGMEAVQLICGMLAAAYSALEDAKSPGEGVQVMPLPTLLMDLQMPVLCGIEAVRRIRTREAQLQQMVTTSEVCFPRLVVLALSANNHDSIVQGALGVGCDAFLQKPFNLEDFNQAVEQINGSSAAP